MKRAVFPEEISKSQMFTLSSLPETIPVFPLPRVILLPRFRIPLNIFEPRYLAMLDDVLKSPDRLVGIIQPLSERAGETKVQAIGCAGKIVEFSETEDKRYITSLKGVIRFRVIEMVSGFSPYLKGKMSWDEFENDLKPEESMKGFDRSRFLELVGTYFKTKGMTDQWERLKSTKNERLVDLLSIICDFDIEEKQALLETPTLDERREILEALISISLHSDAKRRTLQ